MPIAPFTQKVIDTILSIPEGRVTSYGAVAALAGSPRAARQVVRILHSSSRKHGLPWHRVVNREGRISLAQHQGFERQKELLEMEGVEVNPEGQIDMKAFGWNG